MKYIWLMSLCTIFTSYTSETTYPEEIIQITKIVCRLYDKEGVKANSPDETQAKKIGTYRLFSMTTDEKILLQLYGQVPVYIQTQEALFSLPTRTGRSTIENFAQKLLAELEKQWIVNETDKKSFPSCIPPYHRPIYRLEKRNKPKT